MDAAVLPRVSAPPVEVAFAFDGTGSVTLDPWPLGVPWLRAVLVGFAEDGYPDSPEPVIEPILIRPTSRRRSSPRRASSARPS